MSDYYKLKIYPFKPNTPYTADRITEVWEKNSFPTPEGFKFKVDNGMIEVRDDDQSDFIYENEWGYYITSKIEKIILFIQSLIEEKQMVHLVVLNKNDSADFQEENRYKIEKTDYEVEFWLYNPNDDDGEYDF